MRLAFIASVMPLLFGATLAQAKTLCSVEVLSSVCGSGSIAIELDETKFSINYGDIGCWFSNNIFLGNLIDSDDRGIGHQSQVKELKATQRGEAAFDGTISGQLYDFNQSIGKLELDAQKNAAKLSLKQELLHGGRGATYHLQCQEGKKEVY